MIIHNEQLSNQPSQRGRFDRIECMNPKHAVLDGIIEELNFMTSVDSAL